MRAFLAVLLLAVPPARAADEKEAVASARAAFLAGRHADAQAAWRYVSELGTPGPEPEANLALALRDGGALEEASAEWIKASILEGADGFVWNQRGWANLALGRFREAKVAFDKAIDRSSTTATQAEADLGLGLAALLDGKPKGATEPLKRAALAGPYAISAAALLTAESAAAQRDRQTALTFLRQAVEVDPDNDEAMRRLAKELQAAGDNRAAWRAYKRVLGNDPKDEESRRAFQKLSEFVPGDRDAASGVRRIARPVLNAAIDDEAASSSTPTIRVGLYGAPDGRPAIMTRVYLMANAPFKVNSVGHGTLRDNGRAFDQWEIEFRPENGLVEVRDAARNILFTAKQPFTLAPDARRGAVLIKSADVKDPIGVDPGDREVRGAVEVHPNPWGFRLVEVAPLEDYLYGAVSLAMPEGSPPQALRAQAVVSRTAAYWAKENRPETLEAADLLDDGSVQRTIGVSGELRAAAEAVRDTEGQVLALAGRPARVPQHEDSGGMTEDGAATGDPTLAHLVSVQDSSKPAAAWSTALELERFVHEAPPQGLFSEQAEQTAPAAARWVRVVDGALLRRRVERRKDLGSLRSVRVLGRTAAGRVKALEVAGADGTTVYTGPAELQELLGPGALRSTLFTVQPLMDGKRLARLVVWGAGTGSGLGFPRDGALGQASVGRSWREIVAFYCPKLEVKDLAHPKRAEIPKAVGPYKRTLNFRQRKTK